MSTRTFTDIVCTNRKPNNFYCNTYLGAIETSRECTTKHRCKVCKLVYTHSTDDLGMVILEKVEPYIKDNGTNATIVVDKPRKKR